MGLTLQPHVIVICEDIDQLGGEVVVLAVIQSNLFYEVATVMAAIDVCIKACFVMNLMYCHGAKSSWLFLQKALYGINTPNDEKSSKVLQLIADCKAM
jgi:hypothetical protein